VQYYNNGTAMPHLRQEVGSDNPTPAGPDGIKPTFPTPPAKLNKLWPENALFWDTVCLSGLDPTQPLGFFSIGGGWSICASFTDAGDAFYYPEQPTSRYRPTTINVGSQNWTNFPPDKNSLYDNNSSIIFPTDKQVVAFGLGIPNNSYNSDTGGNTILNWQIGAPRFRHNKNSQCNVAFADGTVRTLKLDKNKIVKTPEESSVECNVTEFTRGMYRLKYPSNKGPTSFPYP